MRRLSKGTIVWFAVIAWLVCSNLAFAYRNPYLIMNPNGGGAYNSPRQSSGPTPTCSENPNQPHCPCEDQWQGMQDHCPIQEPEPDCLEDNTQPFCDPYPKPYCDGVPWEYANPRVLSRTIKLIVRGNQQPLVGRPVFLRPDITIRYEFEKTRECPQYDQWGNSYNPNTGEYYESYTDYGDTEVISTNDFVIEKAEPADRSNAIVQWGNDIRISDYIGPNDLIGVWMEEGNGYTVRIKIQPLVTAPDGRELTNLVSSIEQIVTNYVWEATNSQTNAIKVTASKSLIGD